MRFVKRILILLSLSGLTASCVTPEVKDPFGGEVIERSKEQPPAWSMLDAGTLHETENLLKYVEIQTQLTDLPFGIKRTQLDALEASKLALNTRTMGSIRQTASSQGLTSTSQPELERLILEATDVIHREHAKVADIYFEKLKTDQPVGPKAVTEYYRAQVLVHFPKDRLKDLMQEVASRLSKSRDAQLRTLGQAVESVQTTEITH